MTKTMICILCPNSCELLVEYEGTRFLSCTGNQCQNGADYTAQEIRDPRRAVTSSVLVSGGIRPLAAVRLTGPVPKDLIFPLMEQIKTICLTAPVAPGTVVLHNVFGCGCDLIVTDGVDAI